MLDHQRILFIAGSVLALVARPIVSATTKSSSPQHHATHRLAVTKKQYDIQDTDHLWNACHSEFPDTEARVLDIDADLASLSWHHVAPLFESTTLSTHPDEEHFPLQRFQIYWALASPDYLEKASGSAGVVLEYLHGDNALPVLLGDAEVPSRMKVSVLCQLDLLDGGEAEEERAVRNIKTITHPEDDAFNTQDSAAAASTKQFTHGSIRHGQVYDDSTNATIVTKDEATEACGRVHKENSLKFEACIDSLVALTEDRPLLDDDESAESTAGAFADVYHALFQTSKQ